jgi:tRNA pseudouridine32 synthase/23S rRNA pseudouridine746 synthase
MVFAREQSAASELGKAFAERQVEKRYLAISDRKPKKKQGWVRGGMVKARRGAWKLTRGSENLAQTQFVSESLSPGLRAYLLRPRSGRTHQLRVALKSVGAPILGDGLYGGSEADRCYLHAAGLRFELGGQRHDYWRLPDAGEAFCTPEFTAVAGAWRGEGDPWA